MKLSQETVDQIAAIAAEEGLELLATEVVGSGPKAVLRLVVDSENGVNLDQCSTVSRQASALLDVEDPFHHAYTLEVTSPGLERKLYSTKDYGSYVGRRVNVRMKPSYRKHRSLSGELLGLLGDVVRIEDDEHGTCDLPVDEIFEARIEVDWDAIMKEGKNRQ